MSDETAKNTEGTNHGAEPDYSEHFALTESFTAMSRSLLSLCMTGAAHGKTATSTR